MKDGSIPRSRIECSVEHHIIEHHLEHPWKREWREKLDQATRCCRNHVRQIGPREGEKPLYRCATDLRHLKAISNRIAEAVLHIANAMGTDIDLRIPGLRLELTNVIGTQAARVPLAELRTRFLPALRRVARDLGVMTGP